MDSVQGMQRTNHCVSCDESGQLRGSTAAGNVSARPSRQIAKQSPAGQWVPKFGLRLGNDIVGLGKLLNVVRTLHQWVMVKLLVPDPHHMQDDLGVLGVILVPNVVECFPRTRQSNR